MTNRYIFRTETRERIGFLIAAILFAIVASLAVAQTPVAQKIRTVNVGAAYVPPGSIFGLYSQVGFVASSYYYESSLVNYSVPVADSDYLLPYGYSEPIRLPGYSNDRYTFVRTGYITGSGWFETWQAPNGGYIAFLHLLSVSIALPMGSAVRSSYNTLAIESHCKELIAPDRKKDRLYNEYCLNGDRTGLVVGQLVPRGPSMTGTVKTGGYILGRSGWPTDPFYGNGSSGPINAHLCVVYDQAGANWLSYVTYQPRPPTFSLRSWNAWTTMHHKRSISPYYKGGLDSTARAYVGNVSRCHGVVHNWKYDRRNRVTFERFQDCGIYTWSKPGYRPKIVHMSHIL